jgi:hypothetical protein
MKTDIRPGASVAYSATFLRSIGCQTGRMPAARGMVICMRRCAGGALATVRWDDSTMPDIVNVANLVRVEDMHLECVL